MDNLPQDPYILYSFINLKLRDEYSSLDRLCEDMDVDKAQLEDKLKDAGFTYNPTTNHFE